MTIKYKYGVDETGKDIEYELPDDKFLLITAIDNLTNKLEHIRGYLNGL